MPELGGPCPKHVMAAFGTVGDMADRHVLYAAAPGLLISSGDALALLEAGLDHQCLLDAGRGTARELIAAHRLVCLGTGSPELTYRFLLDPGEPNPDELAAGGATDTFDLDVGAGGLVIRDGYDLLDWDPDSEDRVELHLAPGAYRFVALDQTTGDDAEAEMVVHLYATVAPGPLAGRGWPFLEYAEP